MCIQELVHILAGNLVCEFLSFPEEHRHNADIVGPPRGLSVLLV